MPKEQEKQEESKEKYSVVEATTATEPRIFDGKDAYTIEQALVELLNKVDKMSEKIVG